LLLQANLAYADDTPVDEMRDQRMNFQPSRCRDRPVADSLAAWALMKEGKAEDTCIRVRMDYAHVNGCLRDPVAYRCNPTPHHRTGTTFKAYPTYDFACPFVDSIEGVTHALRTSEYRDREVTKSHPPWEQ
jgi:glutamyl/glutaminyl-tRNA synthetase